MDDRLSGRGGDLGDLTQRVQPPAGAAHEHVRHPQRPARIGARGAQHHPDLVAAPLPPRDLLAVKGLAELAAHGARGDPGSRFPGADPSHQTRSGALEVVGNGGHSRDLAESRLEGLGGRPQTFEVRTPDPERDVRRLAERIADHGHPGVHRLRSNPLPDPVRDGARRDSRPVFLGAEPPDDLADGRAHLRGLSAEGLPDADRNPLSHENRPVTLDIHSRLGADRLAHLVHRGVERSDHRPGGVRSRFRRQLDLDERDVVVHGRTRHDLHETSRR